MHIWGGGRENKLSKDEYDFFSTKLGWITSPSVTKKRGWQDETTNLTPRMGLSKVVSLLIFWDRPLFLTLSLQTHLRIFLHAFTDLWTGTTHTLTNQQNKKPNSKLTPCLSWKSPESTIFLAPVYSSKIKHLLRYGLWGQSSRCSLNPLSL